jgi:hypothetical protein
MRLSGLVLGPMELYYCPKQGDGPEFMQDYAI